MTVYTALAQVYDVLTDDVPYAQWVAFAQRAFEQYGRQPHLVLDLACGTGSLTKLLGQAGYEMIAADLSPEMLTVAREKCSGLPCPPVFLCQDMRELDLYGTIDAAVCGLDSLNYLLGLRDLRQVFQRVALFLEPGGLFLFDVKTKRAFEQMAGLSSIQELDGAYCAWQYGYDPQSRLYEHQVDVFLQQPEGSYERRTEYHVQRCYSREQVEKALAQGGLKLRRVCGGPGFQRVTERTERLFFIAQKPEMPAETDYKRTTPGKRAETDTKKEQRRSHGR